MPKVVCVTGGNKGIGFETVRLLCQKLNPAGDWQVVLAARSPERGEKAVETLKKERLPISPVYAQLHIRDKKECEALRDRIKQDYGGLDMLVNNAAIGFKVSTAVPLLEQLREILETNYFATKQVTEVLLPILRDNARVITVASSLAELAFKEMNASTRRKMLAPDLTTEELDQIMRKLIEDASNPETKNGLSCYGLSKVRCGIQKLAVCERRG